MCTKPGSTRSGRKTTRNATQPTGSSLLDLVETLLGRLELNLELVDD
jgi:hypothetical protein